MVQKMLDKSLLETYVRLVLEARSKEAMLTGDRTVGWGSDDHITDLETRLSDAEYWRSKYPKGSERRGHYRNICTHLKRELQSAKKKRQLNA